MTSRTLGAAAIVALLASGSVTAQTGPAATAAHLPADVITLACAPSVAVEMPNTPLRITGGQNSSIRYTHAPGDLITINAGTQNGIEVGQEYYTRRLLIARKQRVAAETPAAVITTGWIRVWSVDDKMSLATITHGCDSIEIGDYLEPFKLPTLPTPASRKPKPERDNYGHVLTGESKWTIFGQGDFVTVDRGTDHGVTAGAQFVLYRDKKQPENFLYDLGEAIAVNVGAGTSTLQITVSRDAIMAGDLVAIRKQ
jgi:hypothetical protein